MKMFGKQMNTFYKSVKLEAIPQESFFSTETFNLMKALKRLDEGYEWDFVKVRNN